MIPAPWLHRDEPGIHELKRQAQSLDTTIDAVIGSAPGWEDPWARARRFYVETGSSKYELLLVAADGYVADDRDVQLAKLSATIH